jgi:GNAT superfamily N-acetyltransferase
MTLTFTTHDESIPDASRIDAGLDAFNLQAAPLDGVAPIVCIARTASGEVAGGAVARTWGVCAELQQLWVAEEHRRQGVGRQLVRLYESRARARGCTTFYLTTFSFQAPSLYVALGYRCVLELDGFPDCIVKYVMLRRDDQIDANGVRRVPG